MNEQDRPFADVQVRRAISYALKPAAHHEGGVLRAGQAADSPLMPTVSYYSRGRPVHAVRPGRGEEGTGQVLLPARRVQHRLHRGRPGTRCSPPWPRSSRPDLKPLNISVKIRALDPSQVTAQEQSFHFGMRETYWTMDIMDPDEYVSFELDGSAGSFANFTHYNNPTMNKLIRRRRRPSRHRTRPGPVQQIQRRSPRTRRSYGWARARTTTCTPPLHGFRVYPEGNENLEDSWLSVSERGTIPAGAGRADAPYIGGRLAQLALVLFGVTLGHLRAAPPGARQPRQDAARGARHHP